MAITNTPSLRQCELQELLDEIRNWIQRGYAVRNVYTEEILSKIDDALHVPKTCSDDVLEEIIKTLESGDNLELDCNTTDEWYGHGWDDCRENLVRFIKSIRSKAGDQ
jgi:hypothetical protein